MKYMYFKNNLIYLECNWASGHLKHPDGRPLDNPLGPNKAAASFHTYTNALWAMEQSSILSAKFDCPVAHQNVSLLATVHDCETGLWIPRCPAQKMRHID